MMITDKNAAFARKKKPTKFAASITPSISLTKDTSITKTTTNKTLSIKSSE